MSDWPWDLHFEVAFDVNPGTEPGALDWTDLSDRIRSTIDCATGMNRAGQSAGSFTIDLNNRDRELDPTYTGSSYNVVPMRHARLKATVDGTVYHLWRGYVDSWSPVWAYNEAVVQASMVDGFAWLALQDADLDLARQVSGDRATALLDAAGWPAGLRVVETGQVWVDAYEQVSANLLRVLEDTADAEDGYLWVDGQGRITFLDRHARFDAVSQTTIGVNGLPFVTVDPVFDTSLLTTIARVELADGDVFEAANDAATLAYGPRSLSIRDLALNDPEATGLAQWVVYRYSQPHMWLDNLTLNGRADTVLASVLDLSVGDLVTFVNDPPGTGTAEVVGHVERVSHTIGRGTWTVSLDVSPYFGAGPWFEWLSDEAAEGYAWLSDVATEGGLWAP